MINKVVLLSEIEFAYVSYDNALLESIKERGMAIPVKVEVIADGYRCLDGNKRLSVLKDLNIQKVLVMISNDFSKAGSGYWGNTRNKH